MKILVLGHTGLLGNAVTRYLNQQPDVEVITTNARYGQFDYFKTLKDMSPDFIINCIGMVPQRKPSDSELYYSYNYQLVADLDTLGIKILNPTTDCEWNGSLSLGELYYKSTPRNVIDDYGLSKAKSSDFIVNKSKNSKLIRTSIIGIELNSSVSLLSWFLSQEKEVTGYTNHYWNGITTLEWAKQAYRLILEWDIRLTETQLGTSETRSKYELLELFKSVFNKDVKINIGGADQNIVNKCLKSDYPIPNLREQLIELKRFYSL